VINQLGAALIEELIIKNAMKSQINCKWHLAMIKFNQPTGAAQIERRHIEYEIQ
jgi:hypothetical protein